MSKKTIWHLGGWNRNYGDFVLLASIKQNLNMLSDEFINFVHIDYQNTHFFDEMIDTLNNEADLLLIGGGGAIFNRPEDESLSGWQFSISKKNIEKIKVPIVIYGIGYNKFYYDKSGFKNGINEHLIETQKKAELFSVRNKGTKEELVLRGLDPEKIEVIPDAGSFLRKNFINVPKLNKEKLKIGLNWVSDRPNFTFPEPYEENKWKVIKSVCDSLKILVKKHNAQIIQIEHIRGLDDEIIEYLKKELKDDFISIQNDIPNLFPPNEIYATFLVDIYSQMDLIIGMRGHANIIPFGVGIPFIALSSHNKNRFFLNEIGEEKYLIDIREFELQCKPKYIVSKVESLLLEYDDYKQRNLFTFKAKRKSFDEFNKKIIELINK